LGFDLLVRTWREYKPASRMAALEQVVTQVIIPLAPMLQQSGAMFDVNAYLQKKAKLMDMPDLQDIVTFANPPGEDPEASGGGDQLTSKPAETKRTYERVSRGGDTANNRAAGINNSAAGGWKPLGTAANGMQNKG